MEPTQLHTGLRCYLIALCVCGISATSSGSGRDGLMPPCSMLVPFLHLPEPL